MRRAHLNSETSCIMRSNPKSAQGVIESKGVFAVRWCGTLIMAKTITVKKIKTKIKYMVDPMKCFRDHFRVGDHACCNVTYQFTVTLEAKREIGDLEPRSLVSVEQLTQLHVQLIGLQSPPDTVTLMQDTVTGYSKLDERTIMIQNNF